jgi:hypothetical protein
MDVSLLAVDSRDFNPGDESITRVFTTTESGH